jgi:hypothetical protein
MIIPEQLINDLQKQVIKLQEELSQAQVDIKDFEKAAIEWKKGYTDMEIGYKIKLANMQQTVLQLEQELDEADEYCRRNHSRN